MLFSLKQFGEKLQSNSDNTGSETQQLAAKMGNITVLRKGQIDSISDGNQGKHYVIYYDIYCILMEVKGKKGA